MHEATGTFQNATGRITDTEGIRCDVYEKIELLQFLVDETLDTNVIRNELETREVLIEAGEFQVANGGLLTSKIGALVEVYGMEHPIRGVGTRASSSPPPATAFACVTMSC